MNRILEWLPYIIISTIPGGFNLPVAYEELKEKCKHLYLFQPEKNPGFWFWASVQFLFPSGLFLLWITELFSSKPNINYSIFIKAVGTGFSFVAFLNARTETKFFTIDIKSIYGLFIKFSYDLIAASETRRNAAFWTDLKKELNQQRANIVEGIDFLESYFLKDVSLTPQKKKSYQEKLNNIRTKKPREEQVKEVESIMDVRRQDLPEVLRRFNCSDSFLKNYFPAIHSDSKRSHSW